MKRAGFKNGGNGRRYSMMPDYSKVRVGDMIAGNLSPLGKVFGEVKVIKIENPAKEGE